MTRQRFSRPALLAGAVAALTLLLSGIALAQTQGPGIPHQFFGTVRYQSGATSDGLRVEARVGSVVVGHSTTKNSSYGFTPNLLFATDPNHTNNGKPVIFTVGGTPAHETAVFTSGESTELNLTIPGAAPGGSTSISGGTSAGSSSSGGGGGGGTPAAPSASGTTAADTNRDGKINILDFNTLIVQWGSAGANNLADFDKDGTVGILDFNFLMVRWTG